MDSDEVVWGVAYPAFCLALAREEAAAVGRWDAEKAAAVAVGRWAATKAAAAKWRWYSNVVDMKALKLF